jgi:hypothetical protein
LLGKRDVVPARRPHRRRIAALAITEPPDTRPIRGSGPLFDEVTSGLLRTLTLCGWGS